LTRINADQRGKSEQRLKDGLRKATLSHQAKQGFALFLYLR